MRYELSELFLLHAETAQELVVVAVAVAAAR
jgi:hypothetical protein